MKTHVKMNPSGNTLTIMVTCPKCDERSEEFYVCKADWDAYRIGRDVSFDYLSASQRDMLKTGVCIICKEEPMEAREPTISLVKDSEIPAYGDVDYEAEDIYKEMLKKGWAEVQTGGGCTAYYKKFPGHIKLITSVDGPSTPDTWSEKITVGTYTDEEYENGEDGITKDWPNMQDYLQYHG